MSIYDVNGNSISGGSASSVFVNVKDFGAKGNNSTDDAAAIQSAIDSIKTSGGTVFFPSGTYLIGAIIRFYSNQHLLFDRNAVLKGGSSSINALLLGYVNSAAGGYTGLQNVIIEGGTFERGSAASSTTLIAFSHAINVMVKNAVLKSAPAWHDVEFNSTKFGIIENCVFDGTSKNLSSGCQIQLDNCDGSNYPWSDVGLSDQTACDGIEIRSCLFENNTAAPNIGSHSNSGKNVRIYDCTFNGNTGSRGAIQFDKCLNLDVFNNTFTGCTNGISFTGTGAASCCVHDNRFTDATTAIHTDITVAYNNWINGTFTE